jgi:hypothetical protein
VNVASNHYNEVVANVKKVGVNVSKMDHRSTAEESIDTNSVKDFEDFLYNPESRMRSESQAIVPVGFK